MVIRERKILKKSSHINILFRTCYCSGILWPRLLGASSDNINFKIWMEHAWFLYVVNLVDKDLCCYCTRLSAHSHRFLVCVLTCWLLNAIKYYLKLSSEMTNVFYHQNYKRIDLLVLSTKIRNVLYNVCNLIHVFYIATRMWDKYWNKAGILNICIMCIMCLLVCIKNESVIRQLNKIYKIKRLLLLT